MKTKKVTTQVTEAEERESPKFSALVKGWLNGEIPFSPELTDYDWKIIAFRWDEATGKAVRMVGRIFENLEQLPIEVGRAYGFGRYRFMMEIYQDEKKVGFVRVEDFPLDPAEDAEDLQGEEDPESSPLAAQVTLQIERERQAHELKLAEMTNQKELLIAALNAKGGGAGAGVKVTDMIELLKTGIVLGRGQALEGGEVEEGDLDGIMKLLNSPLAGALVGAIGKGKGSAEVSSVGSNGKESG